MSFKISFISNEDTTQFRFLDNGDTCKVIPYSFILMKIEHRVEGYNAVNLQNDLLWSIDEAQEVEPVKIEMRVL